MSAQLMIRKFNKELEELKENVTEIKKYLFSPLEDSEGEYQSSFVKKMLKRAAGRDPFYRFKDKRSFLKHVRSGK